MTTHDPELFAGTAYYYARYRPPYPAELFTSLASAYGLEHGTQVLDLGCGTGQLALPLARAGSTVWAIDPDPDMIAEGVRAQAGAEHGNVRWMLGRAEDLRSAGLPRMRLAVMGASFHWMDRDLVLKTLDQVIEPGGGVALVSGAASIWSKSDAVQGDWLDVTRDVVRQFLGPERRAGRGTYSHPPRGHEEVLRDSAFSEIQSQRLTSVRLLSAEDVVGQQLSTSYASPAQLGDRLADFRAELSRRLLELSPAGEFETVEHTDVIMARRGPAGSDHR